MDIQINAFPCQSAKIRLELTQLNIIQDLACQLIYLGSKMRLLFRTEYSLCVNKMQRSCKAGTGIYDGTVLLTRLEALINWFRKYSIWPLPAGTSCCAIELMASGGARFDLARFGSEIMRFSPRQADVMIVAGTVTYKMAPIIKTLYEQMTEPKWVIAMGACACTGGMFRSYSVLQGVDRIIPVDLYIAGCPPRPEAILQALIQLQQKIQTQPLFRRQIES